jgi:hypothetical protein
MNNFGYCYEWAEWSMKKALYVAVVCSSLLSIPMGYAWEHPMEKGSTPREGRPGMSMPIPDGPMGGMMGHEHMGMMLELMKNNPKVAGVMMQMHGDMMRIRGEELTKMGDVMKRYGERLEKESAR